jgi:anti-sigma B factor antagonist
MIDINTRVLPGAAIRVSVAGEIDLATMAELETALTAAVGREGAARVEVDFAGVTFCDSTGIAALDQAYAAAAERSLPFRLINVQPTVARVLSIVGLLEILTGNHQP